VLEASQDGPPCRRACRVRPQWAASRAGSIRDIGCFVPCHLNEREQGAPGLAAAREQAPLPTSPVLLPYEVSFKDGRNGGFTPTHLQ
jgi:hypothetical protein